MFVPLFCSFLPFFLTHHHRSHCGPCKSWRKNSPKSVGLVSCFLFSFFPFIFFSTISPPTVSQSVKDVLLSLEADGLVSNDKVGVKQLYWAFPSDTIVQVCPFLSFFVSLSCLSLLSSNFSLKQNSAAQMEKLPRKDGRLRR